MLNFKSKFRKIQRSHLQIAGVFLLVFIAALLVWVKHSNIMHSNIMQPMPTVRIELYFEGEYRIADGPWQTYVEGEHISSLKGDVTLRGNFYKRYEGENLGVYRYNPEDPDDQKAAFYVNHINLTFIEVNENEEKEYYVIDNEYSAYGDFQCGETWTAYGFISQEDEEVEILVHNPHTFGNENAIDEMMQNLALWSGIEFEKELLDRGDGQRDVGAFFVILALIILGIALFSTLIHIKSTKIIWVLGITILFAGIYFSYSAEGVSFWNDSVVLNTTVLGTSMMFYMFFVSMMVVYLSKATQKVGNVALTILGVAIGIFLILPIVSRLYFYDIWPWWIAVQLIINLVLICCLVKEIVVSRLFFNWIYISAFPPLVAFAVDVFATWRGIWEGGMVSRYVFVVLSAIAIITVLKLIPQNINAAAKAKELEMEKIALNAELSESRISTMMSQIRPHFIYNTLGSIEQLCKFDPPKAGELVHNFAKYLRGNFGELDNPKPILMSQEMEHVHYYVSIENVRFPDMTFTFEMNSDDFYIPALTIQPIVENAIKHGLMKLSKGGTIRVESYETDTDYCILVVDDGAGFDTSVMLDERKHVGLRNIRERLKVMVNGKLEIESTVGEGTKVYITIPKGGCK